MNDNVLLKSAKVPKGGAYFEKRKVPNAFCLLRCGCRHFVKVPRGAAG